MGRELPGLGGYDEQFIGYGLDDIDFGLRAAETFPLHILDNNDVFHLWHRSNQTGWREQAAEEQNRRLFEGKLKGRGE